MKAKQVKKRGPGRPRHELTRGHIRELKGMRRRHLDEAKRLGDLIKDLEKRNK